jgi:hypothetical protein
MQHDRAALIVAHDVERVLTDINADYGDCGIELLRHGVLLVFGSLASLKRWRGRSTAGPSRTRRERPQSCAADKREELAPLHSSQRCR